MQKARLQDARESLAQAEAMYEHYQYSVLLYKARIARLEKELESAPVFAIEKRA
jgi:hypothetical protein